LINGSVGGGMIGNHYSSLDSANISENLDFNPHELDHDTLSKLLPEDLAQEADTVFQELEQQKIMREEFEKRMEEKLTKVEGENQILKRLFLESHQKNLVLQERMEKVLKTLYNVYMTGGVPTIGNGGNHHQARRQRGGIPRAITAGAGRIPVTLPSSSSFSF
jgi:hypothetical protein